MALHSLIPFGFDRNFDPFNRLHHDINRLFNDVTRNSNLSLVDNKNQHSPSLDICETENELVVTVELPGVEQKDIHVELNNNILTIKGEKKIERTKEGKNYHLVERSTGNFQRSIQIPFTVVESDIQATFNAGVLTVTLPKAPTAKNQSKQIEIKTSPAGEGK